PSSRRHAEDQPVSGLERLTPRTRRASPRNSCLTPRRSSAPPRKTGRRACRRRLGPGAAHLRLEPIRLGLDGARAEVGPGLLEDADHVRPCRAGMERLQSAINRGGAPGERYDVPELGRVALAQGGHDDTQPVTEEALRLEVLRDGELVEASDR